jgi:hypothetical protein
VGPLPSLQPLPIRDEFVLVQFRPGFDQPVLAARKRATDQLDGVNALNTDSVLVVRVEMRPVMWSAGFGIHTNNDPKKACNLWHVLIIPQEIGLIYLLIVGGLTPAMSGQKQASGAPLVDGPLDGLVGRYDFNRV